MISLLEILKNIKEDKNGLVPIDDWKLSEAEYLFEMGFTMMDEYKFVLDGKPRIVIFKKKHKNQTDGNTYPYYFVDDRNTVDMNGNSLSDEELVEIDEESKKITKIKKFRVFEDVEKYFNEYYQPALEKNL